MQCMGVGHQLEGQPELGQQGTHHPVDTKTADRRGDRQVETNVGIADLIPVIAGCRRARGLHGCPHLRQAPHRRRSGERAALDQPPHRVDVPHVRSPQAADEHPTMRLTHQQPLGGQGMETLTQRVPGDAQGSGELVLLALGPTAQLTGQNTFHFGPHNQRWWLFTEEAVPGVPEQPAMGHRPVRVRAGAAPHSARGPPRGDDAPGDQPLPSGAGRTMAFIVIGSVRATCSAFSASSRSNRCVTRASRSTRPAAAAAMAWG